MINGGLPDPEMDDFLSGIVQYCVQTLFTLFSEYKAEIFSSSINKLQHGNKIQN